ncbi:transcriptional regulation of mitochondrial recombination-domain-containing protein [Nemania sp. NC0429]|nr:transcriptional regulation of mitochondrial recombination-domain-containing protein [Nemania sp. NC0429]
MATRISPITAQLGSLSISSTASRTSIRLAHTRKRKKGERIEPNFEPGHGEKIFVFNHFLDGLTVYSHSPVLKANHAFRQIPFNGKQLRPSKLRKDYWRPLAMIQFPEGQGEVGRSVFQRLRECKKLHEYAWDDSMLYGKNGRTRTRHERGKSLNDQRANTIADMAAVLAGLGKGNKIVVAQEDADKQGGDAAAAEAVATDEGTALVPATVWWVNELDRNYAKAWTKNVSHELFKDAVLERIAAAEETKKGESESAPAELVAEQELTKGAEQNQRL